MKKKDARLTSEQSSHIRKAPDDVPSQLETCSQQGQLSWVDPQMNQHLVRNHRRHLLREQSGEEAFRVSTSNKLHLKIRVAKTVTAMLRMYFVFSCILIFLLRESDQSATLYELA